MTDLSTLSTKIALSELYGSGLTDFIAYLDDLRFTAGDVEFCKKPITDDDIQKQMMDRTMEKSPKLDGLCSISFIYLYKNCSVTSW